MQTSDGHGRTAHLPDAEAEELRITALEFLREGQEDEAAAVLEQSTVELNEGSTGQEQALHVTLRCCRTVIDRLTTPTLNGAEPALTKHLKHALSTSLPGGYALGSFEARAAKKPPCQDRHAACPLWAQFQNQRQAPPDPPAPHPSKPQYLFEDQGRWWRVIFESSPEFLIGNTLGARYINHLLHHPNQAIGALDLEQQIVPEKSHCRGETSVQPTADAAALREVRKELADVQIELEQAEASGDEARAERLRDELAQLKSFEHASPISGTRERAHDNVRKAIAAVLRQLQAGDRHQKAFAAHLQTSIKLGVEVIYFQPKGRIW